MTSLEYPIFGAVIFMLGVYGFYTAFKLYKQYQFVRDTPTSDIESIAMGTTEVSGTVKPGPSGQTVQHPMLDGKDCVYYKRVVEKYDHDDDGSNWNTVEEETVSNNFSVTDGTGEVLVNPAEAEFDLEDEAHQREQYTVKSDDPVPRALSDISGVSEDSFLPNFLTGERYRVTVDAIWVGLDVFVFGTSTRRDSERSSRNEENIVIGQPRDSDNNGLLQRVSPTAEIPFVISNQSEKELLKERKYGGPGAFLVGLVLTAAGLYLLLTGLGL